MLVLYCAIVVPLGLAFDSLSANLYIMLVEVMSTVVFVTDILMTFNTALRVESHLITDRTVIAKEYLRFWFFVDFISVLPIGESVSDSSIIPYYTILYCVAYFSSTLIS